MTVIAAAAVPRGAALRNPTVVQLLFRLQGIFSDGGTLLNDAPLFMGAADGSAGNKTFFRLLQVMRLATRNFVLMMDE